MAAGMTEYTKPVAKLDSSQALDAFDIFMSPERHNPLALDFARSDSLNHQTDLLDLDGTGWPQPSEAHTHFDIQQAKSPHQSVSGAAPSRDGTNLWTTPGQPLKNVRISNNSTDDSTLPGFDHWSVHQGCSAPLPAGPMHVRPPLGACVQPLNSHPANSGNGQDLFTMMDLRGVAASEQLNGSNLQWQQMQMQCENSGGGTKAMTPRMRSTLSRGITKRRTSELSDLEKKERRRQSNRESARRSRARKIEEVQLHEQQVQMLENNLADKQARLEEREQQIVRLKQSVAELNSKCKHMHTEMVRLISRLDSDHDGSMDNETLRHLAKAKADLSSGALFGMANAASSDRLMDDLLTDS